MNSLMRLDFFSLRKRLLDKELSASEVISAYIERAEETRHLNAYILETFDIARSEAQQADKRYASGEARPLEGLPLAIKDMFCTKNIRTTACSKILENFVPPYESTVSKKLKNVGAICLGKTNLDEFAMGSSTLTSCFGPSINPIKKKGSSEDLTPGGSSGGSSASLAAGSSLAALGTDTGGSIRQPAGHCGVVGIKPTYGRCSRYGVVAFASSLDHVGPMARTVRDTALVLEHMAGHDPKDSTCINRPVPPYTQLISGNIKGIKIGIPKEYNLPELDRDIARLWQLSASWLKDMGAQIQEVSLPHTEHGLCVYYIVNPAEASSNFARYDGVRYGLRIEGDSLEDMYRNTRTEGFGDEVKRRIMIGTHALSAGLYEEYYLRAQKVRRKILDDFKAAFQQVDFILTPTTASPAFALNDPTMDPMAMYLEDVFTVAANLSGVPAISVPVGLSQTGLPLGMQLLGPMLSEERLFNLAFALETAAQFKHPVLGEL